MQAVANVSDVTDPSTAKLIYPDQNMESSIVTTLRAQIKAMQEQMQQLKMQDQQNIVGNEAVKTLSTLVQQKEIMVKTYLYKMHILF